MSFERLLRAKEELERNPPPVRPKPQVHLKQRVVTGHLDKQGKCHCGADQICSTYVCAECDRMVSYAMINILKKDEYGLVIHWSFKRCACGAKHWLYGCEGRSVRR